jgi:fluoroacetyl-CoA thioesterase
MKRILNPGETKLYSYTVKDSDVAAFQGAVVHHVMATFSLAREIEWSTRLFVLDIREDDEEGIGTMLTIEHRGPAFVGESLTLEATVESMTGNELICTYVARVGDRLVATGKTGQKLLKREKIAKLFRHE